MMWAEVIHVNPIFMSSWGDLILVSTLIRGRSLNIAAQFRVFIVGWLQQLILFFIRIPPLDLSIRFNIIIIFHKIIQNRQFCYQNSPLLILSRLLQYRSRSIQQIWLNQRANFKLQLLLQTDILLGLGSIRRITHFQLLLSEFFPRKNGLSVVLISKSFQFLFCEHKYHACSWIETQEHVYSNIDQCHEDVLVAGVLANLMIRYKRCKYDHHICQVQLRQQVDYFCSHEQPTIKWSRAYQVAQLKQKQKLN